MIENVFKKQEKIQKQQELNDDKNRELTDEEMEQVVGGTPVAPVRRDEMVTMQVAQLGWGPDDDGGCN